MPRDGLVPSENKPLREKFSPSCMFAGNNVYLFENTTFQVRTAKCCEGHVISPSLTRGDANYRTN